MTCCKWGPRRRGAEKDTVLGVQEAFFLRQEEEQLRGETVAVNLLGEPESCT